MLGVALALILKIAQNSLLCLTPDPDPWFLHTESVFWNAQITQSRTKFDHIVQKLPQNIIISFRSLIWNSAPSSATPFEDLKAKLVSSYSLSHWQQVANLYIVLGWGIAILLPSWTLFGAFSLKIRFLAVYFSACF